MPAPESQSFTSVTATDTVNAQSALFVAGTNVGTTLTTLLASDVTGPTTPASASATGVAGTIVWDSGYIYVCVATDTWKRVAIATW